MKLTQKEQVLRYLKQHGKIDNMQSLNELNIYRLSDVILKLRADGWKIVTHERTLPSGKTVGEYHIVDMKPQTVIKDTEHGPAVFMREPAPNAMVEFLAKNHPIAKKMFSPELNFMARS